LDSSGSLTQAGFDQEKLFIQNFIKQLTIGPTESRVALTEFGQSATQMWTFTSTTQSQSNLQNQVGGLAWYDSSTNITGGLQDTAQLFANSNEQRHLTATTCIPQVAVLVTDGRNNVGNIPPSVPAAQLRAMGVNLYAVGIGPDASQQQLNTITGDPSHVFMVDYTTLQQIVTTVVQAACSQKPTACPNGIPPAGSVDVLPEDTTVAADPTGPTVTYTRPSRTRQPGTRAKTHKYPGCRSHGAGNICSNGQGGGVTNNPNNPANNGGLPPDNNGSNGGTPGTGPMGGGNNNGGNPAPAPAPNGNPGPGNNGNNGNNGGNKPGNGNGK